MNLKDLHDQVKDQFSVEFKELRDRKQANSKKERVNNASLRAGSPMYYYCKVCGEEQILSKDHLASEIKQQCDKCKKLLDGITASFQEMQDGFLKSAGL